MENVFFIPIRKGSKGIPDKNMKLLGGKPLYAWVVDAIIASATATEIWIATDSDDAVRQIGDRYGGRVRAFRRSDENAHDSSPVIEAVLEFLKSVPVTDDANFILAQATSPFTAPDDFSGLVRRMSQKQSDSFIACQRLKKFIWDEVGHPLSYNLDGKPLRQNYRGFLIESGAFYASTAGQIRRNGQLISGKVEVIESSNPLNIDIDEPIDWLHAEAICREILKIY